MLLSGGVDWTLGEWRSAVGQLDLR
jgi:hypothetical protein